MNRSTYLEGVHGTINVSCPCRWACYMDGGVVGEPRKLSPSLVRCQDSIQQKGTKMNGSGLGYWAGEKRRGKKGQQRAQIYEETLISGATTGCTRGRGRLHPSSTTIEIPGSADRSSTGVPRSSQRPARTRPGGITPLCSAPPFSDTVGAEETSRRRRARRLGGRLWYPDARPARRGLPPASQATRTDQPQRMPTGEEKR